MIRKNALRLDHLFDYMGVKDASGKFDLSRSFFLGNSGYFLLHTEAHSKFLTNGRASIEKLQKKGWLQIQPKEKKLVAKLKKNKFILFYDKNGLVRPHNELLWLKCWKTAKGGRSTLVSNEQVVQVPQSVLDEIPIKMKKWTQDGPETFGLPSDWNSCPLSTEKENEILYPEKRKKRRYTRRKKTSRVEESSEESESQCEPVSQLDDVTQIDYYVKDENEDAIIDLNVDFDWGTI